MNWIEWQSAFDPVFPKGVRAHWRNTSFDRLDGDIIDVLVRRGEEQTWVGTAFDVHHFGGAFGQIPEDATPFPNRSSRFWINIYGFWTDEADDDARVAFVRAMSADMEPFATGGQYLNFQGQEQAGPRVIDPQQVFGAAKFERLVAVKRQFDPDNTFHIATVRPRRCGGPQPVCALVATLRGVAQACLTSDAHSLPTHSLSSVEAFAAGAGALPHLRPSRHLALGGFRRAVTHTRSGLLPIGLPFDYAEC